MRLNSSECMPSRGLVYTLAMAGAVVLAAGLSLCVGLALSLSFSEEHVQVLAAGGLLAVASVAGLIGLGAWLVDRSARMETFASLRDHDASSRSHQLHLVVRLAEAVSRESRQRPIISRAIDFFVDELRAASVVYWKPGVDGEPAMQCLARTQGGAVLDTVEEGKAYRSVVARQAARDLRPLYLEGARLDPRFVDVLAPPEPPFHLFLPLPGREACEGLFEIQAAQRWNGATWPMLELLAAHIGAAIERGRRFEEMRRRADVDFGTGVFSYRFMHDYLQRLLTGYARKRRPVVVIMLDVDGFKTFNDTLGHAAGDRVLQLVAGELQRITGKRGIVGRCGGDEFMVVLPDQSLPEAEAFKEGLADWLASDSAELEGGLRIRLSCGSAVFPYDGRSRQELLAVADARLYKAKAAGDGIRPRVRSRGERATVGVYGVLDRILDTMQERDHFTRAHCETTAECAVALAQHIGLSTAAQRTLRLAGLLHDVGKIGLPAGLLDRASAESEAPGLLDHQLDLGDHLIADVPNAEEVRLLIRQHHERWDGSGYPRGLKGEEIPHLARVLAVADSYSYIRLRRPELSAKEACVRMTAEAGKRLDPALVQEFARVVAARARPQAVERADQVITVEP